MNSDNVSIFDSTSKVTPQMSSDTNVVFGQYVGTVIGNMDSSAGGRNIFHAFDKQITTRMDGIMDHSCGNWTGDNATSRPNLECNMGFHFTNTSLKVYKWSIDIPALSLAYNLEYQPSKLQLYASNNGINYEPISPVEDVSTTELHNIYYISNNMKDYTYFLVKVIESANARTNNICIDEVEFYGL